jgi:hypothetical protein
MYEALVRTKLKPKEVYQKRTIFDSPIKKGNKVKPKKNYFFRKVNACINISILILSQSFTTTKTIAVLTSKKSNLYSVEKSPVLLLSYQISKLRKHRQQLRVTLLST